MALNEDETRELAEAEVAFEAAGGRGVELAERIDELRFKRDAEEREVTVTMHLLVQPGVSLTTDSLKSYLDEVLGLPQNPADTQGEDYWVTSVTLHPTKD